MTTKLEGDSLTLKCVFDSGQYGKVGCNITIKDGIAVAVFADRRLAKDMYFAEKKLGIDDVYYEERLSCYGTRYPNKTKEEISKLIIKKLDVHNVYVTNERKNEN